MFMGKRPVGVPLRPIATKMVFLMCSEFLMNVARLAFDRRVCGCSLHSVLLFTATTGSVSCNDSHRRPFSLYIRANFSAMLRQSNPKSRRENTTSLQIRCRHQYEVQEIARPIVGGLKDPWNRT
jgi:hypothetical protein